MDFLKFTLSGQTAFFKKPEVNANYYFTYGNIHKVALLGIFGAIVGYQGYNQMSRKKDPSVYPEFYEKLNGLNIGIVPGEEHPKGYIGKKIHSYNNSVGYASCEAGGTLIVKEQWLECPSWDVYMKLDCEEAQRIKEFLLLKKCIYMPYLGTKEHVADIGNVMIVQGRERGADNLKRLHSFCINKQVVFDDAEEFVPFKYEEYLPIALNEETNLYEMEKFVCTNLPVLEYQGLIWEVGERNIVCF